MHVAVLPAREGRNAPWPQWVDADVVAGYAARGITRPWLHQVNGLDALAQGRHLALATPTGSGKSLVAWAAAVTAARAHCAGGRISQLSHRPTTIYLSPTKALAADQLAGLTDLLDAAGITDVRATTVDGDTPMAERDWARDWADLVLTNPDFLHYSLLPRATRWARLLRGLRYVVVDEVHAYRGMTGAHVSLVLRRLLRLADHYGAAPQVIVVSATAADPAPTAARLLGTSVEHVAAVTEGTSPEGERTVVLWRPPPVDDAADDSEEPPRRSTLVETAELLTELVTDGRRVLAFTRSRVGAETIADLAREYVQRRGGDSTSVAAYRGGYLPEERRALERGLREGTLLGVASTNALELGVDISGLDAVVIAGWPGTHASFWQQAGRAGRAGAAGTAVLVASENPLEAYLVHHPQALFTGKTEPSTFDPQNPHVLAPHLCAAAAESPLRESDIDWFADSDPGLVAALLAELVDRGLLRRRPAGWFWNYDRPEAPTSLTDLRGGGGPAVAIVEAQTGRMIGTVDATRADAAVHAGAVYVHQGTAFEVLSYEDDVAVVERSSAPHRTRAHTHTRVRVLGVGAQERYGHVTWQHGPVEVTTRVTGFDRRRLPHLDLIGTYALELPERTLRTTSTWWTVPAEVLAEAGVGTGALPGALHAAEHAQIALLGLVATCDRWDLGGLSTSLHEHTFAPTVFVHDAFPGGSGFARRGFDSAREWVEATLAAVRDCPCSDGCPLCIQSPKCGNGNSPLDKAGAVRVLRVLAGAFG